MHVRVYLRTENKKKTKELAERETSGAMRGPLRSGCPLFFFVTFCSSVLGRSNETVIPKIQPISINKTFIPHEYLSLPIVGKCCKLNEVLVKNESNSDATCSSWNTMNNEEFSPHFNNFNATGIMEPAFKQKEFIAVIGDPCKHKKYMLEPSMSSDDQYYLLLNGTIFAPKHIPIMLTPRIDYCMEVIPDMGIRVLVCFPQEMEVTGSDSLIMFYACGLLISVPFLLLTITAYTITPRLLDIHGKALCHYCACLALAFTTLAAVQLTSNYTSDEVCIAVAFIIQFSFIACFFWLNVMCIEIYLLVRRHVDHCNGSSTNSPRISPKKLFFYYSLWAWVSPSILVLISVFMDLSPTIPMTYIKPKFGTNSCWFNSDREAMPYFYIPMGMLICINLVLFTMTAIGLVRYQRDLDLRRLARNEESDRQDQRLFRRVKRIFFVCIGLFFLMGINWAIELISWCTGGDPITWSAFDLVNALQGLLIFGLFVLRKPVRNIVWCRIQNLCGMQVTEPEVGSMALYLLPVINGVDSIPPEGIS